MLIVQEIRSLEISGDLLWNVQFCPTWCDSCVRGSRRSKAAAQQLPNSCPFSGPLNYLTSPGHQPLYYHTTSTPLSAYLPTWCDSCPTACPPPSLYCSQPWLPTTCSASTLPPLFPLLFLPTTRWADEVPSTLSPPPCPCIALQFFARVFFWCSL